MIISLTDVNRLTDKIYDVNHKPIDFDYKKFVRIIHRIENKDPRSDELKKKIERDNFRKIPNGVYYCSTISNKNELTPCLLFDDNFIWTLGEICFNSRDMVPESEFIYCFANLPLSNWHTYVAMSKILYAMGEDIDSAAKNLKLKIFDRYRSQILNMEKRGRKR